MYQNERNLDFRPIGKAIKAAREAKGWTQEHLAQLVDRSPRNVMYIENRGQHPRLNTFYQLMTLLDISVDQFFYLNTDDSKSDLRSQIDFALNSLSDKELTVIQGAIQGVLKARDMEE
ncbi:MAG: helix-turn-helix transcriptional regulator [Muricomes sp.]